MPQEVEYRPVEGFPAYRVGSNGTIQSCWVRRKLKLIMSDIWSDRATGLNNAGYPCLVLCDGFGGRATKTLHRLVAAAFVPNPRNLPLVRHLDGVKTNAAAVNLMWGTYPDNYQDSLSHGTSRKGKKGSCKPKGSASHRAKFSDAQITEIRSSDDTGTALARRFGVGKSTISRIRRGLVYVDTTS